MCFSASPPGSRDIYVYAGRHMSVTYVGYISGCSVTHVAFPLRRRARAQLVGHLSLPYPMFIFAYHERMDSGPHGSVCCQSDEK